jgi:hypothetical protein
MKEKLDLLDHHAICLALQVLYLLTNIYKIYKDVTIDLKSHTFLISNSNRWEKVGTSEAEAVLKSEMACGKWTLEIWDLRYYECGVFGWRSWKNFLDISV